MKVIHLGINLRGSTYLDTVVVLEDSPRRALPVSPHHMLPPPTSPEGETAASEQHWFACPEETVITVKVLGHVQMKIEQTCKRGQTKSNPVPSLSNPCSRSTLRLSASDMDTVSWRSISKETHWRWKGKETGRGESEGGEGKRREG